MEELEPGSRIGRFEVQGLLGRGGMGAVYAARDPELERSVAIKLIIEPDAQLTRRLLREAQVLAQLQHPHVVAIHEVGQHGEGVYLAMELVDGVSLDRMQPRPANWREVVALYAQVGRGLAAAHDKGLVHRDIKPANLLVGRDGRARVGDFGLARRAPADEDAITAPGTRRDAADTALTEDGAFVGTPRYMAPEQHACRPATARSDQFSFCVAMWEALFGVHPFDLASGDVGDAVLAGRRAPRPATRGVPRWLGRALDRGLAREPDARFPSMHALVDVLATTPARRRRRLVIAGTIAAAATITLAALVLAPDRAPAPRCADPDPGLAWSGARFAAQRDHGADTARLTAVAVARHAARWRDARLEVCRATVERGAQSPELRARRDRCLDHQRAVAAAVLATFAAAGPAQVDRALDTVEALPDASACSAERLTAARPLPADPRATAITDGLVRLAALRAVGEMSAFRTLAGELRAPADALAHPGLRAEVLLHQAEADPAGARALLELAIGDAVRANDRDLEATATVMLLRHATAAGDLAAVKALLPLARAASQRPGTSRGVALLFLTSEAPALLALGRHADALAACAHLDGADPILAPRCRCRVARPRRPM